MNDNVGGRRKGRDRPIGVGRGWLRWMLAAAIVFGAAGCGASGPGELRRSKTTEEDPAGAERAREESERMIRENQEAEERFFKKVTPPEQAHRATISG